MATLLVDSVSSEMRRIGKSGAGKHADAGVDAFLHAGSRSHETHVAGRCSGILQAIAGLPPSTLSSSRRRSVLVNDERFTCAHVQLCTGCKTGFMRLNSNQKNHKASNEDWPFF
jgi:hypothetical protein